MAETKIKLIENTSTFQFYTEKMSKIVNFSMHL